MTATNDQMAQCIEQCFEVARLASACLQDCLSAQDVQRNVACVRLCLDAVDITEACGAMMARGSQYGTALCAVCAQVCEACAGECEKMGGGAMQQCAQACRRCAQTCRSMTA